MARRGFQVVSSIGELAEGWDALRPADATPFTRHAWLRALEESGCASPRAGWAPHHLTLWREGVLVAAAPAYLKSDSDGDFARDWNWSGAAARAGVEFFPKLCITVPFTPVSGERFLVAPGESRAEAIAALLEGARAEAKKHGFGSIQLLYPRQSEMEEAAALGFIRRVDIQYHWHNAGYRDYDQFLSRFSSKARHMLKRERAAALEQGISIRTLRGVKDFGAEPLKFARLAHQLHKSTVDKLMWGRHWLDGKFYARIFESMPEALELVVAEHEGRPIAGAFNVAAEGRLFGRYWGCLEDHRFLHFNVCYYHSIEECIHRGVRIFEGGAGGEHKVARGFEPSETWGAFDFTHAGLKLAVKKHLDEEWQARHEWLAAWRSESPTYRHPPPGARR